MFTDILIIKPNWCDAILNEGKIWEVRGHATKKRETIGLAKSGTSKIYGEVDIVDCVPLTKDMYSTGVMNHHIPLTWEQLLKIYPTPYAWILNEDSVKKFDEPIPFNYPRGAVIWVRYEDAKITE